jgi:hypothetical protein
MNKLWARPKPLKIVRLYPCSEERIKMDIKSLITEFKNWDLGSLSEYADSLSTKTEEGQFFPPYVPLVGNKYERYRILIYATAQNIPPRNNLREQYSKNFDKLIERLYYSPGFKKRYPEDRLDFHEVAIGPYQLGVLPALAGVFIYTIFHQKLRSFDEIQDHIGVSNYYKFSLHNKKDINPNDLPSPDLPPPDEYFVLNDQLVSRELEVLKPAYVIAFRGRHVQQLLKKRGFKVEVINDPAWILKGASGCLKQQGSWGHKVGEIENNELVQIVNSYLNNLRGSYQGKRDSVRIYLLKYHLDWQNDR